MDGGDVTEMGEDWGEARVRRLREGKEAELERSVFGRKSDIQVKVSLHLQQQRSNWGYLWQVANVAGMT